MKRGQASAANFLAMLALFIVIYILLLPESEKIKLVGGPDGYVGPGPSPGVPGPGYLSGRVLLSEAPGEIFPFLHASFIKPLASVNLFSVSDTKQNGITNTLEVSSGFFSSKPKTVTFRIDDIESLEGAALLFFIQEGKGVLKIKLNGEEIFNGPVVTEDLPISLPTSLIGRINKLEFSVNHPGINIFGVNRYSLKDVQIIESYQFQNKREARPFVLSKTELSGLNRLSLNYIVNCSTLTENGMLNVYLNNRVIHQGLIVCDAGPVGIDLNTIDLVEGRNILEFEIDKGKYVLEQVTLDGDIGQEAIPNYVFTVKLEDAILLDQGAHIGLNIIFDEPSYRKLGTIIINGFPLYLDTIDVEEFIDLTPFIKDGQNVIRIIPETQFNILSFDVFLE